ncbi:hypothetical protein ACP3V5_02335 [Vibrio maritimus]
MKFDSLMSSVVSSKLDVISSSLDTSIQRVDRLGIPYQSADNLIEQFNLARERESDVTSISLIDNVGRVLVQTSEISASASTIPEDVVRRALTSNEPRWLYSDDTRLFSGLQIFGDFENLTGSLVIEYDKTALFGVYALVRLHLLEATVVIFLVTSLTVFFVVRIGFSDVANVFRLIHNYSSGEKPTDEKSTPDGSMSRSFADQIKQSEQMKAQVSEELERLQALSKQSTPKTKDGTEVAK